MIGPDGLGRFLTIAGAVTMVVGGLLILIGRLGPLKLPGDIYIQKENFVFYFPLVSSIILSIILTIILNLLFRR